MIDRDDAEHYTWGQNCDGWHLLKSSEVSVIQERMGPDTFEMRHVHNKSRQFFFVLSGEAVMEMDGNHYHLHAKQGIEISPHTPHQMMNKSTNVVEFLVISSPPSHGDRVDI